MDSEASMILGMLAEGKIDTGQALELLKALEESEEASEAIAQVEAKTESTGPGEPTSSADAGKAVTQAEAVEPARLGAAASENAQQKEPEKPAQRSEPSPWTRVPGPERIGEIAGSIGEIIASSVDKGIEVVTRIADQARHEADHIQRRVKRLHIERNIARPVKRLASAVKPTCSHGPGGAFSKTLADWSSTLEQVREGVPDTDPLESLADALENTEDAAKELASLLEHVDESVEEASDADDLDDMAHAVEEIAEDAEEALDQVGEVEQALHDAQQELDEIPGDRAWAEGLVALKDAWPGIASVLRPRLEAAMRLGQDAKAALREMIVSWAKAAG